MSLQEKSSPSAAKFATWSFDEPCKSLSSWTPLSEAKLCLGGYHGFNNADNDNDNSDFSDKDADLVFVCHYNNDDDDVLLREGGVMKDIDTKLNGALSNIIDENRDEYQNGLKPGSMTPTFRIMGAEGGKSKRYVLVGLGKKENVTTTATNIGNVVGKAIASKCTEEGSPKLKKAILLLPQSTISMSSSSSSCSFLKDMSTSFYSSLYIDNRFRGTLQSIKKRKIAANHLEELRVDHYHDDGVAVTTSPAVIADADAAQCAADAITEGRRIAEGVHLAKDIVNAPHNVLNSLSLADLARKIAAESDGSLTCQILGKEECEQRGMGAYLGVARASETPPQFIHLTYKPPLIDDQGEVKKKVGVVGKGLLFDTGGYNIKTVGMELMKFDCGGAAAVLGAAKSIGSLKPSGVECHFVIAACENMINDKGIVPSDVLVASNGVTIEVVNTDAEGRLTLADALVYCDKELNCEKIIELSTLTGACMVALGKVRIVFTILYCTVLHTVDTLVFCFLLLIHTRSIKINSQ